MRTINFKVNNTEIFISDIGLLKGFEKEVFSFLVRCKTDKEDIHFIFYESVAFTQKMKTKRLERPYLSVMGKKEREDLIYSILACIEMDYNAETISLKDFIDSYGYEYSEETINLFHRVEEQKNKLHKVFTDEDIKLFDENDDTLKDFVNRLEYIGIEKEKL